MNGGYDALLDSAYGANTEDRPRLVELVQFLIAKGAELNTESEYGETAIAAFSWFGRFDAVRAHLDAGANPAPLNWSPLHFAVALGSLEEVRQLIDQAADIEARDSRKRTPYLLAVAAFDIEKADLLLQGGASSRACAHCGDTALILCIEGNSTLADKRDCMMTWLVQMGADIEQTNEFGHTPLRAAAEQDNSAAVRLLLAAGAILDGKKFETALYRATSRDIILQLLDAGADPQHLSHAGQRILIGLGEISHEPLMHVAQSELSLDPRPRYGASNPEKMDEPFWKAMIRAGIDAYFGGQVVESWRSGRDDPAHPIWCAQRFGQSFTRMPDGRIIQIAGEHEDSYNEDFCIYNDVFVHDPDGSIEIYGYPEDVFPPTDFHTATLVSKYIYVIGSVGYVGARRFGETQVFRLDTDTFVLERLNPTGPMPGWISEHRAKLISPNEIAIAGGKVGVEEGGAFRSNDRSFILDLNTLVWREC